ncbi:lipoyl(octanoyl) transferase [Boudabousia liubingyangii]|uniref:Octanoyltransferase n=1 Tax=Boudabousia liubingyangii TaxID=1921764 RepID=A0A1Q5PPF6_9ACTO|nr:lipoyl(octanoyl) transferase LipB [Boudabousia liubingyangii]OKL49402.1 lipoyl(octanoyl) transferase [Boudabousia liubingyangii]
MRIINLLPQGPLEYQLVNQLQHQIHADVVAGIAPDTIIALEHEDTYTAGRRTQPGDAKNPHIPVHNVDRGGRITYHGPGQLVLYPIFKAAEPVDVVKYVRGLEQSIIAALREGYGLETTTVEGRSGVWLTATDTKLERKICAIGVKFAQATTLHGIALNVTTDLSKFEEIIPCGISDAGVASLEGEGIELPQEGALAQAAQHLIPQIVEDLQPLREPDRLAGITETPITQTESMLEQAARALAEKQSQAETAASNTQEGHQA